MTTFDPSLGPSPDLPRVMAEKAELSAVDCELGVLQRADGSARVVQTGTSVLCAVYGPAEVKASKEQTDRMAVEVVVKPEGGLSGPRERLLEHLLTSALHASLLTHLHPHTALSLTAQVERDAGRLLSVLAHAACLAMLDACLPMASTFTALTCALSPQGQVVADPSTQEEEDSTAVLVCIVDSTSGDILTTHTHGSFTADQLQECMLMAVEASKGTSDFYRQAIRRKLSKEVKYSSLSSMST